MLVSPGGQRSFLIFILHSVSQRKIPNAPSLPAGRWTYILEKGLIGFLWPEDLVWYKYSIANKSASDTTSKKGLTELWSV